MIWNSDLWKDCFVCWFMYLLVDVHLDARVLIFFLMLLVFGFSSLFFSASPSWVDVCFFFCCSSLFGAGDLWICLGYRVYILDSSHVVSIHPSPSSLWPLILLIGATVGVAYKIQTFCI